MSVYTKCVCLCVDLLYLPSSGIAGTCHKAPCILLSLMCTSQWSYFIANVMPSSLLSISWIFPHLNRASSPLALVIQPFLKPLPTGRVLAVPIDLLTWIFYKHKIMCCLVVAPLLLLLNIFFLSSICCSPWSSIFFFAQSHSKKLLFSVHGWRIFYCEVNGCKACPND